MAAGIGSLRDELFFHALLSPGVCNDANPAIPSLMGVLEFAPGAAPPILWQTALRRLGPAKALPKHARRYIYGLVFSRLEPPDLADLTSKRAMAHGLLSALATAHRRGVINVDLRDGHMYFDRSDGTYRLIDWDCSITIAAAAGRDPAAPRDSHQSCAVDQPAVPVHFWEEILSNRPPTIAPESLFSWRDGRCGHHTTRPLLLVTRCPSAPLCSSLPLSIPLRYSLVLPDRPSSSLVSSRTLVTLCSLRFRTVRAAVASRQRWTSGTRRSSWQRSSVATSTLTLSSCAKRILQTLVGSRARSRPKRARMRRIN